MAEEVISLFNFRLTKKFAPKLLGKSDYLLQADTSGLTYRANIFSQGNFS